MNRKFIIVATITGVIIYGVFVAATEIFRTIDDSEPTVSPQPTGSGVTLLNSPTSNVSVVGPLNIKGSDGIISNILWDSGIISLSSPVTLGDEDKVYIDVDFSDPVLMKMTDMTGVSSEKLTVELLGTVIAPDISGGLSDTVEFMFQFDGLAEEFHTFPVAQAVSISSTTGSGAFEQSVELTDTEVPFGGFTLKILQNGTGEVQINKIRVALEADDIRVEPIQMPKDIINNGHIR